MFAICGPSTAQAQSAAAEETVEVDDESMEKLMKRPTLDLGLFKVHDLRPTRNETAKVTFAIHLAFTEGVTEKQVEQLAEWKHRLRDQIITAVRASYIKDFQEPSLALLRRKILIRVNRLFERKVAEEVLLTEYMFRTN
ncbi:MAG: flagellar basal body-associated FliL family protein [Planctomycetota bacterium]